MAGDKIKKARDLVDEGKYAQARRLLKGNDDPRAKRLMEEINDLAPASSGGTGFRDALQVILLGLIFTALFGGIGYVIASGMGISQTVTTTPTRESQSVSGNVTPDGTQSVAIEPSATPAPTEIPCEAQAWWDTNRTVLAEAVNNALTLSIATPGQQINANKTAFQTWRGAMEAETVAPCLQAVQGALSAAAPSLEALYNTYLSQTNEQQQAQALVKTMDALLPVTDEIDKLNVTTAEDTWITTVQDFTRGECPAKRWYNEIILAKDYKRFFTVFDSIDYAQAGAATNSLREMQSLRGSFQADSAAFPECLKPASDALLVSMEGFIGFGNSRLQNDAANADSQLNTATTSLATFYGELSKLDGSLSGIRLKQ
jgi:hypothetical protein